MLCGADIYTLAFFSLSYLYDWVDSSELIGVDWS